jgi:hypothetical protein
MHRTDGQWTRKNEDVMADNYNLTQTYLLPAYMADWVTTNK